MRSSDGVDGSSGTPHPTTRIRRLFVVVGRQARTALQNPARVSRLLQRRYWQELRHQTSAADRGSWSASPSGVYRRAYQRYGDYLDHQRSKLELLDLAAYDRVYRDALRSRLESSGYGVGGKSTLCLAARIGTEVKAFADLGSFAVGVDLNPGAENPYVLPGDFHALQFPDACVDVVFTNSLDHALEPERLAAEVHRVLKPAGVVILELAGQVTEVSEAQWETFAWSDHELALEIFTRLGLAECYRAPIDFPESHDLFVILRKR